MKEEEEKAVIESIGACECWSRKGDSRTMYASSDFGKVLRMFVPSSCVRVYRV